ncbi:peptidoglycan editing factor PgeF [Candidatus Gottesmanbacteria bacterium]|nr:peptidoglycan editing factor PgeF [Candidatus Gottesmanbacteria bacterium]
MNDIQKKYYYTSPLFAQYNEVFHGTTTKQYGPIKRDASTIEYLCGVFGRKKQDFITGQQTHGNTVLEVNSTHRGVVAPSTDGLVLHVNDKSQSKKLFIGVFTADCVPVFFYDPKNSLVGICHAGWKGVIGKIVKNMVKQCIKCGSNPGNLRVCLGPHIRSCSYSVAIERARLFEETYGKDSGVVAVHDSKHFINLSEAISLDLKASGVNPRHIDHDCSPCTYCDSEMFYSYRRRIGEEMHEMISFIGIH